MLNIKELPNGDLRITAGNEERAEIAEWIRSDRPSEDRDLEILVEMTESYWTNGSWRPFSADDANPFVGLSSAPCIAEDMDMDDEGNWTIVGRFWAFTDYQILSFAEQLRDRGYCEFELVG